MNLMNAKYRTALLVLLVIGPGLLAQESAKPGAPKNEQPVPQTPLSKTGLDHIARMKPLFDGKTLDGWISSSNAWAVKDGAMASTGAGRGVIYTKEDYGNFRLIFNIRHVSGQPDHQACVLIFCTRPAGGEKGLDA